MWLHGAATGPSPGPYARLCSERAPRTSLWSLLPAVVEAVKPVPVIAAGGIANGKSLVAALRPSGARPGEGTIIGTTVWADGTTVEVPRYTSFMVTPHFKGDLDYAPIWAGESCSQVKDIKPPAQIVREAEQVIAALSLQTHPHHNNR